MVTSIIIKYSKGILLTLLVVAIICTSCLPPTPVTRKEYVPGQDDIKGYPMEDGGYYLLDLNEDIVISSPTVVASESSVDSSILTGRGRTDDNGVVSFREYPDDVIFPVALLNENNEPVENVEVNYISDGDQVTIVVTDKNRQYSPVILGIDKRDLLAYQFDESTDVLDGYFGVTRAKAVVPIVAAVVIVLAWYKLFKLVKGMYELDKLEKIHAAEVFRTGSSFAYDCIDPELFKQQTFVAGSIILALIPYEVLGPFTETEALLIDVAGHAGLETINAFYDGPPEPLFIKEYYFLPENEEVYLDWVNNYISEDESYENLIGWEMLGYCAYVPDVIQKNLGEAATELENRNIHWIAYDENGKEVTLDDFESHAYIVRKQEPEEYSTIIINNDQEEIVRSMHPAATFEDVPPLRLDVYLPGTGISEVPDPTVEPVTIPDVMWHQIDNAIDILEDLGLKVSIGSSVACSSMDDENDVGLQKPVGGNYAEAGDTVTLYPCKIPPPPTAIPTEKPPPSPPPPVSTSPPAYTCDWKDEIVGIWRLSEGIYYEWLSFYENGTALLSKETETGHIPCPSDLPGGADCYGERPGDGYDATYDCINGELFVKINILSTAYNIKSIDENSLILETQGQTFKYYRAFPR